MKRNRIYAPLLCILLCNGAQAQTQQISKETYIRDNYTKMERYITMRDGIRLFTAIYVPKDQTRKYPILINRTTYSVSPYGENNFPGHLGPSMLFVKEGYIFVRQDVRGRWMSEGDFVDVRPHNPEKKNKNNTDESSDTYDTVEWLLKNLPSNNGRVGIYGISYPGFYASASLPGAHPALKAVSPQAPVTDWFIGDDFHHNGALMLMDAFGFYSSFGVPRPKPITPDKGPKPFQYYTRDSYKFYQELGPLKNVSKRYFADSIKFWNDLMAHGSYDDFWKAMNIRTHLTNIKPATLVVGGFFDAEDCFGTLHIYESLEKQNSGNYNVLVMGPWSHGAWSGGTAGWPGDASEIFFDIKSDTVTSTWYQDNIEFPFFQHFLNDKPDRGIPEATVFETGTNKWRSYDAWPPRNSSQKYLYFHEKGGLSFRTPGEDSGYDEYVSDPAKPVPYDDGIHLQRTPYMIDDQRFASRRPDVMVYQTPELTDDITLAGPVIPDLFVSTTGTDADFIVKLIDVYPDDYPNPVPNPGNIELGGYQMMVRADVMRGKFRHSYEMPEPLTPGMVTEVKYIMTDVSHCFRKGHRIMVQVQNSWFPLVDLNPQKFTDIYHADEKDFRKATQRIYHNSLNPSCIIVNILK
jgi:putative CocE/NonD family hydrolase